MSSESTRTSRPATTNTQPAKQGEVIPAASLDLTTMRPQDFAKVGITDQISQMRLAVIANADKDMALRIFSIMASWPAKQRPISFEQAFAAYVYESTHPGQQLGRDFYIEPSVGVMIGYPGVEKDAVERKVGHLEVRYRVMSVEESELNEIKPGDSTAVCEVYQLDVWERMRRMGVRYEPIVGFGIVRDKEKWITEEWTGDYGNRRKVKLDEPKPVELSGGYTWHRKARNRAYKDALRHVPGLPKDSVDLVANFVDQHGDDALPAERELLEQLPFERLRVLLENAADVAEALTSLDAGKIAELQQKLANQRQKDAEFVGFGDEPEEVRVYQPPAEGIEGIRERILAEAQNHADELPTERQLRFANYTLALVAPEAEERAMLLEWLFGPNHELTQGDCEAIIAWGKVAKSSKTGEAKLYGNAKEEWELVKQELVLADESEEDATQEVAEPDEEPTLF